MQLITAWLLGLMLWAAPHERAATAPAFPGWEETTEERQERFEQIAEAAAAVAFDPEEKPILSGPHARARTASTLLAIAFHESGFARDVDIGPCYRGAKHGKLWSRCDGGRSACMTQQLVDGGTTWEGWTREELFADREKCFRAALHKLRRAMCWKQTPAQRFAAYASGSCDRPTKAAAELAALSQQWINRGKPPIADALILLPTSPVASY